MMTKKKSVFQKNRDEIIYNLINAGIAGGLVFAGGFVDGDITQTGICAALVAAVIVGLVKFRTYWDTQKDEYQSKVLNFI